MGEVDVDLQVLRTHNTIDVIEPLPKKGSLEFAVTWEKFDAAAAVFEGGELGFKALTSPSNLPVEMLSHRALEAVVPHKPKAALSDTRAKTSRLAAKGAPRVRRTQPSSARTVTPVNPVNPVNPVTPSRPLPP